MSKDNLIPELRFPEFEKDGEWEEIRLKQAARFYRGLTYGKGDTSDSGLLVLRSGNIQNDTLVLDKDLVFVDKECSDELKLLQGDVVICMSNGSKALVGKNAVYQGEYNGKITVGAFCSIMRPDNKFITYILKTDAYQSFISLSIGGGNINNLKNSDLEEYECAVPSNLDEQQKIASCLSSLDELIAAHNDKLDTLKDHKKGLLQNLFPQEGETVPKVRFPEFEADGEWVEKELSEVSTVITGSTPSTKVPEYYDGDIMFVSPADISNNKYVESTEKTLSLEGFEKTRKIKANSVMFVCIGSTIGKVAMNKFECSTNQQINSLVPHNENSSDFLYSNLELNAFKISGIAGNQAVPIINKTLFSSVKLKFPPTKEEQQKIAFCLSAVDELITAQHEKIDELQQHKKGLMQGLFPKIEN